MKNKLLFLSVFFVLIATLFSLPFIFLDNSSIVLSASTSADYLPTVIVDAGHGGEDGGAVAIDGTNEKDYNLEIALKLSEILKLHGYNVIMTRTEDIMTCDVDLNTLRERKISDIHNRLKLTTQYPNAVFVSIHQNKFSDSAQKGTQVFYSKNNSESQILAQSIQDIIKLNLQPENNRAVKKSGTSIYLLYNSQIPSVLVECGFLSNYDDLQKLKSDEYKTQLAMLIAQGIIKYKTGD